MSLTEQQEKCLKFVIIAILIILAGLAAGMESIGVAMLTACTALLLFAEGRVKFD